MNAKIKIFRVAAICLCAAMFFSCAPSGEEIAAAGLPIIKIETPNGAKIVSKDEWMKGAKISVEGAQNPHWNFASVDLQIKGRGNTTWKGKKKPYALKLEEKREMLGLPQHKRWVLLANYFDKSLLRTDFASFLGNEIFDKIAWNPHFEHASLFLNGEYLGDYLFGEQIKIDKNRVPIAKTEISDENPEGSFLCEVDGRMDEPICWTTSRGYCLCVKDPDDVGEAAQEFAKKTVQNLEDAIFEGKNWRDLLDEDSIIDWYLTNEVAKNHDARFQSSVYFYYDAADKKFHFGPNWDFDISCGNCNYGGCDDWRGIYLKDCGYLAPLFADEKFAQKVKVRWNEIYPRLKTAIDQEIPAMAQKIEKSANANFKRWRILGFYVWPNPRGWFFRRTYKSEVKHLQNWLSRRVEFLNEAINEW